MNRLYELPYNLKSRRPNSNREVLGFGERKDVTRWDPAKIRSELSVKMGKISPSEREEYLEAAKDVGRSLLIMAKIKDSSDLYTWAILWNSKSKLERPVCIEEWDLRGWLG